MMLQLNPMLPLQHVTKGAFTAFLVTDYSQEHSLLFTGFLEATGEIWTFSNRELRAQNNITMGRELEELKDSLEVISDSLPKKRGRKGKFKIKVKDGN